MRDANQGKKKGYLHATVCWREKKIKQNEYRLRARYVNKRCDRVLCKDQEKYEMRLKRKKANERNVKCRREKSKRDENGRDTNAARVYDGPIASVFSGSISTSYTRYKLLYINKCRIKNCAEYLEEKFVKCVSVCYRFHIFVCTSIARERATIRRAVNFTIIIS